MKKYIILILILFTVCAYPQANRGGKARGLFMSLSLGPRFPLRQFAKSQNIGTGINIGLSYTDNEILPLFIYAKLGYEHYPGTQELYKHSDYSSFSSNVIPMNAGVKIFLPPVIEDLVLVMPTLEFGGSVAIYEKYHQFKIGSGKNNFIEQNTKAGFQVGAGVSMFLIEFMGYYNYFLNNEYLSADLSLRLPIFIKL